MHRGPLPAYRCRHHAVDGLQRPSGRTASRGNTPSTITSPARRTARPRTEISPGARAHSTPPLHRAHGPPGHRRITTTNTIARLTRNPGTDKRQRAIRAIGSLNAKSAREAHWAGLIPRADAGVGRRNEPAPEPERI